MPQVGETLRHGILLFDLRKVADSCIRGEAAGVAKLPSCVILLVFADSVRLDRQPGPCWEITDARWLRVCVSPLTGGVMTVRSFSATKRSLGRASVRLELAGDVRGVAAELLTPMILDAIVADWADELHVDLDAVTYLDSAGVLALVCGYAAAVECGSIYRVVNAQGQVQQVLEATGVMEMLADSEDLGALVLALLILPPR